MRVAPVFSSISRPDLFLFPSNRLEYLFGALLGQQHEYMMQESEKRAKTTPSTIAAIRMPSILLALAKKSYNACVSYLEGELP